jgi:hypothetical protein
MKGSLRWDVTRVDGVDRTGQDRGVEDRGALIIQLFGFKLSQNTKV